MATVGYTSIGASTESFWNTDEMQGVRVSIPANFVSLTSLEFYGGADSTGNMKPVILDSGFNIVTNGIGNSFSITTTEQWYVATFPSQPDITPGSTYYLSGVPDVGWNARYENGVSGDSFQNNNNYSSPTSPGGSASALSRQYSIFANYVESSTTKLIGISELTGLASITI